MEDKIEQLEKQIKYLYDKLEICAYGKQELQEIAVLEYELEKLKNGDRDYE